MCRWHHKGISDIVSAIAVEVCRGLCEKPAKMVDDNVFDYGIRKYNPAGKSGAYR